MLFGNKIRELRESQGLLLRQLAAELEIDTATMSKIELGVRKAKKEQVANLAKLLNTNKEELFTLWLAEKVYDIIDGEQNALDALKVAENLVEYNKSNKRI